MALNAQMRSSDDSRVLLDLAKSGDDSALWNLAEQLRPYLKAVVRRDVGRALAGKVDDSDIVQQSMVRAVNKFKDFEGASLAQWQAWLVAIVHNEARNTVRYWHQQRRFGRPVRSKRCVRSCIRNRRLYALCIRAYRVIWKRSA
jgi:DNA-directed RNA polymerase specialized sigma24 family protein